MFYEKFDYKPFKMFVCGVGVLLSAIVCGKDGNYLVSVSPSVVLQRTSKLVLYANIILSGLKKTGGNPKKIVAYFRSLYNLHTSRVLTSENRYVFIHTNEDGSTEELNNGYSQLVNAGFNDENMQQYIPDMFEKTAKAHVVTPATERLLKELRKKGVEVMVTGDKDPVSCLAAAQHVQGLKRPLPVPKGFVHHMPAKLRDKVVQYTQHHPEEEDSFAKFVHSGIMDSSEHVHLSHHAKNTSLFFEELKTSPLVENKDVIHFESDSANLVSRINSASANDPDCKAKSMQAIHIKKSAIRNWYALTKWLGHKGTSTYQIYKHLESKNILSKKDKKEIFGPTGKRIMRMPAVAYDWYGF